MPCRTSPFGAKCSLSTLRLRFFSQKRTKFRFFANRRRNKRGSRFLVVDYHLSRSLRHMELYAPASIACLDCLCNHGLGGRAGSGGFSPGRTEPGRRQLVFSRGMLPSWHSFSGRSAASHRCFGHAGEQRRICRVDSQSQPLAFFGPRPTNSIDGAVNASILALLANTEAAMGRWNPVAGPVSAGIRRQCGDSNAGRQGEGVSRLAEWTSGERRCVGGDPVGVAIAVAVGGDSSRSTTPHAASRVADARALRSARAAGRRPAGCERPLPPHATRVPISPPRTGGSPATHRGPSRPGFGGWHLPRDSGVKTRVRWCPIRALSRCFSA